MNAGFGTEQLVRLRDLVTAGLGLAFADEQLEPLGAVATKRMHTLNLATSHEYLARLEDPEARRAELAALAQFLTVPETFFFRGEEQFRVLIDASTAKVAEHGRALRLLSAGCASGEEPYSLAIALREALRSIQDWNISIDAFDVNPSMIDAAKRGSYGRWSLRATPDLLKQRYFRAEDRTFEVDRGVKAMVRFECKNLADPASLRAEGAYDAIFCRNVLMYFDLEVARRIIRSFEKALKPT
ncbi:MAG TPA: CheR family methyltransferase, partial [Polyangiaceae bacterium]|nr:CheR family methyltransferase [Polyangiaceae bacterium]